MKQPIVKVEPVTAETLGGVDECPFSEPDTRKFWGWKPKIGEEKKCSFYKKGLSDLHWSSTEPGRCEYWDTYLECELYHEKSAESDYILRGLGEKFHVTQQFLAETLETLKLDVRGDPRFRFNEDPKIADMEVGAIARQLLALGLYHGKIEVPDNE